MSKKLVFENATSNSTSEKHRHDTGNDKAWVHISGTMDGCTVTPWVTIGDLPAVALDGVAWTVVDVNSVDLGKNHVIDVRITSVGESTDISVEIDSPDGD